MFLEIYRSWSIWKSILIIYTIHEAVQVRSGSNERNLAKISTDPARNFLFSFFFCYQKYFEPYQDENDRFFAYLKVAEKENKDDQLFKQGIDSLLKAPMQRLLRYPLLLERYKKEAENERIDSLSIDEINRAICSIRNIRFV